MCLKYLIYEKKIYHWLILNNRYNNTKENYRYE